MASAGRPWAFGSDPPNGSGRVGLGGRYMETRWSIVMLEIMSWSWTLLHSTSIRKVLMVPQG